MRAVILIVVALLSGCAARPSDVEVPSPVTLSDTVQFDLDSVRTGRTHRLLVSIPPTAAPARGHPVIYLLDGNSHFASMERLVRTLPRLAKGFGVEVDVPIIVGLSHPGDEDAIRQARGEDYTPPGADRFLDFLKEELEPELAKRLPIDRSRTALMGHSYGGLLVVHALFTRPESFETFVAGSPSIWWNDRHVLQGQKAFLERKANARVLVTVGGLEQTPRQSAGERGHAVVERRMVDHARALAEDLEASDPRGELLEVLFVEFPSEDHYSAWLPMLSRGLLFFSAPALLPPAH